jgi:hypothetical protein
MSFYTSLVVIQPLLSNAMKVSLLCVLLRDPGSGSNGIWGWKSSTKKLVLLSWVFVGWGLGPPAGGSAIG